MSKRKNKRLEWLHAHVQHRDDQCLIWPFSRSSRGYGAITIGGKHTVASRVMCLLAHGYPSKEEEQAAHSCGAGRLGCVNPRHLRWASPSENNCEAIEHGTHEGLRHKGSGHPLAKLDDAVVLSIRAMAERGMPQARMCEQFGLSSGWVSKIINRKVWKHI